jgi:hypothetical protein
MALPGLASGEFTAEGTEHNDRGWPDTTQKTHQIQSTRRMKKLEALAGEEGWIEVCGDLFAKVGIIGWGSTGGVVREAVRAARAGEACVKGIVPHLLFPEVLSRGVEMESGGDLLLGDVGLLHSIDIHDAGIYGREHLRRLEPPDGLLRDLEHVPDERGGRLPPLGALPRSGAQTDRGDG